MAAAVDHSLQRKNALAQARPVDNAGAYVAAADSAFDLSTTIFKTLPQGYKTFFQRTKLDAKLLWHPQAIARIEAAYTNAGPAPSLADDANLHRFMLTACDFSTEHADGSFLDHLHFCREYAARHYSTVSPRIMLLHSIMGVGTNCFPMELDKLPALRSLLTADEMVHVEAFPSVLRLLIHGPLLTELVGCDAAWLSRLRGLKMRRLLDNAPLEISAEQLWVQLNLQMIHAIDFLPPGGWQRTSNEYFFAVFIALHKLLTAIGKRDARVEWDESWRQPACDGVRPPTWRHWLIDMVPCAAISAMAAKQIGKYSAAIGHSLEYELVFADASPGVMSRL